MTQPTPSPSPRGPENVYEMPDRGRLPEIPGLPVFGIVNLELQKKTWGEWTADRMQVGAGAAIESLVSGILLGIGQVLIQEIGGIIKGATPVNSNKEKENGVEHEALKLAACTGECDAIIGADGKVKAAVLKMLKETNEREIQNYPAYFSGVIKCVADRKELRRAREGLDGDGARRSPSDANEKPHSQTGKADEKNREGKGAAG